MADTHKSPNDTVVVVTGATGYLATHIVHELLAQGYQVRGTVRSVSTVKYEHLNTPEEFCPEMVESGGKLKLYQADLMTPDSFDEAIDGADYVLHTACPCFIDTSKLKKPKEELVQPAVFGVENVIASIEKTDSVKKLVLTSSTSAVYDSIKDHKKNKEPFTEKDWNTKTEWNHNAYFAAKRLQEEKAWELKEKSVKNWDMSALLAGILLGESKHPRPSLGSYGIMTAMLSGIFRYGPNVCAPWTDVDDFARLHILSMQKKESIPRVLCVNATLSLIDIGKVIKKKHKNKFPVTYTSFPKVMYRPFMWKGFQNSKTPFLPVISHQLRNTDKRIKFDTSLIVENFNFKYKNIEDSILEMVDAIIKNNMIPYKRKFVLF
mmetsp:Transcript_28476/g.34799  ORF Transcript_28476/g.34799 Transcript_28476/m.34799 type:complete len:377 (+) Transcript_28476:493-1623(+)